MTTYVINPITNELESAQPRQRVADKFKLEDLLTPGPLRDELKGDFDPTQETYEEYLRRINLRYGGSIGGGVIQGEKVGGRENFAEPLLKPSAAIKNFLRKKYPEIKFNFEKYPLYGVPSSNRPLHSKVSSAAKYQFVPAYRENVLKKGRTGLSAGIGIQRKAAANKKRFFEVFDNLIAGEIKLGENVKKLNPDLKTGSLALQTLAANSGVQSRSNMRLLITQHPWYKQNKNIWNYSTKVLSGDFKGKTLPELLEFAENRIGNVKFTQGRISTTLNPADSFIMKSALRHWDSVNRLQDPTATNRVQFYYKGSKTPINWNSLKVSEKGIKDIGAMSKVEFTLDGKPTRYSVSSLKTLGPNTFPEVYKKTNEKNRILNKDVTDIKGKKVKLRELVKKAGGGFTIDLDHIDGVMKNPFSNLRVVSSDLNNALSAVVNKSKGSQKYKKLLAKEILGEYSTLQGALFENALAEGSAKKMNSIIKGNVSNLTPYQTAALSLDKKLKNQDIRLSKKDIDVLNTALKNSVVKIKTTQGEGPAKKFAVKAGLKSVAKALPFIGTVIGAYDVNKALQAGITDPRDLYTAFEVSVDVAAKQKAIREDPTGELLQEEIAALPEIVSDDQILDSLGPMQKRENFQDGTPPVIPGNEPDYSELQVMLDNPNEYNTFPKGTFAEEMDKAVYGTNEERNLLQKFNSMFLDPRAYPYYAQKLTSGAANIPELAFRFPASLGYLYGQANLALATADFDRIRGKTLMEALEILDPKYTRELKNTKFGDVIGISDKSMNEKDKTEGQKFVGDTFELGAEAVGPATPIFLFKMFPKLSKQIKDLVGTASAADKVNKEIEKNLAVDQSKRDLILTIGAGGAVAALKFLGLDKLIKAPKATKAVTSAVKSGGTPQYFFDFVNLIKRKGKDVSDRQAVVERQKVIEYKDYTLTDTDGYITVRKTDEDMGRDEMMEYTPPEGVVDEATGKAKEVPAQYDEVTARPDANDPGNFDTDQGFDSIDQVLEELAKDGKKYTVKELEEMGINTFVGDDIIPNKVEKAEGGIIAGVKSGPAPKSGPTPHGLPYLAKNVTPIKERK